MSPIGLIEEVPSSMPAQALTVNRELRTENPSTPVANALGGRPVDGHGGAVRFLLRYDRY
jgi:hypothetical protein